MNIKALRKDYQNLSVKQRLAILDNAIARGDDSEAQAIANASPRKTFTQTDYGELYEEINRIRFCNLIVRLGYIMTFDFGTHFELENLNNKSSLQRETAILNHLRLTAFLYVRATDAWKAVNEELGLRNDWDAEIGQFLFSIKLLQAKDAMMREFAFSEDEARAYLFKQTGKAEIKTLEDEIEGYREHLSNYRD